MMNAETRDKLAKLARAYLQARAVVETAKGALEEAGARLLAMMERLQVDSLETDNKAITKVTRVTTVVDTEKVGKLLRYAEYRTVSKVSPEALRSLLTEGEYASVTTTERGAPFLRVTMASPGS